MLYAVLATDWRLSLYVELHAGQKMPTRGSARFTYFAIKAPPGGRCRKSAHRDIYRRRDWRRFAAYSRPSGTL